MKAEDRTKRWLEDLGSQVFPHVLTRRTDIPLNLGFQELSPGLLTLAPTLFSLDDQDGAVLRQDLSLGRLVEAGEEGLQLSASLGFGWSLSWRNLPYSLVNTATARMALFGEPSSEAFQMELAYCLDEFRRLLAGLRGHALVVSGLDGIELMHDSWLQTPWGRIKSASPMERRISVSGSQATAILVSEAPVTLSIGSGMENFDTEYWSMREQDLFLLALSCLLAGPTIGSPGVAWTTTLTPGQMGSGGSARAQTRAGWGNLVLRETDLGNVSTWCSLVESRHHRKLNVAASRLLRAVRERDQPDDALVDAVISLEALFGVGEVSETTFRVSAACARLLEADLAKRQEVRKRIADAYGARSRLVHGAQLEAQDIERHRDAALSFATEAFRVLLSQRPDLIDSENRASVILLE